ncbi:LysR substrate-binding domain-containing protein [Paracoccus sp. MBLB3053]|uniref:LysR substrate-binding domain-containing protein n=1 Tax=Paracoccus aurantius TaxID=3073814 RepID=A0ABU2HYK2_9RHOB|nr:LysR substrate-binding domain-containing protein [Paracoccus sp. MBLB3053]MDS9470144.1 LysR substrate-binding domain-containing protein [Paracoccus sp. MBLB3053]
MKLRDLEYLVALAEQQNFHRAAAVCGVSQPTLSAQIRKFEDDLGLVLFERSPRNVSLTPAGGVILARARRVLDEVAQMRVEADNLRNRLTPSLHLGVFPTLGPYLLPHVVPQFLRRFPGVEPMLTEEKSEVLLRKLVEGKLDAALLALPVTDSQLAGRQLFEEPFRLAVPRTHPLAGHKGAINPTELAGEKLMLLDKGHCLRDQALALCRDIGALEYDDFRATSLETLRQMVVAGVGVTLLPEMACRPADDLVALRFASTQFRRRIGLFWRKSTSQTALMQELADLIAETASAQLDKCFDSTT